MRKGKFTASEIWKLFVEPRNKKDEWSKTAQDYILEKAIEQATGYRQQITSKAMEHGIINEKDAFDAFKERTGDDWQFTGKEFFEIGKNAGASPDAILSNDLDITAVADFKCPQPLTFFEQKKNMFQEEPIDRNYFYQLQMQMLATGAKKAYLVYYLAQEFGDTYTGKLEWHFDLPLESRIFSREVSADPEVHSEILLRIEKAEELKRKYIEVI